MKTILKLFLFTSIFLTVTFEAVSQESQFSIYTPKQQQLRITADNVRLVPEKDASKGGYHLYVKKLPNVNSILLTETTKDPTGKNDNYAYRALEYNEINGDEIRYLDGKQLVSEGAKFSLIDSTVENTDFFGPAFHIYIPPVICYGYEWTRHGEVTIGKGTFINIRSFEKPYADYSGDYMDSPFMFDLVTKKRTVSKPKVEQPVVEQPVAESKPEPVKPTVPAPLPTPAPAPKPEKVEAPLPNISDPDFSDDKDQTILTDQYNPVAAQKFEELSEQIIYSKGPESLIDDILECLEEPKDKSNFDLVFAIDATGSMKDDLEKLKEELIPELERLLNGYSGVRIGLLFYRDYGDTFHYMELPVKVFGFSSNLSQIEKNLNSVRINGKEGGDIPEAVYEAIYAASEFFAWRTDSQKKIILIGDAEPHPFPRGSGKYSKEFAYQTAQSKGIKIKSILLPRD